nr:Chain A, RGD PEPTIDE ISOMER-B [synthetic construct]1FUV_A Chain A, RGD PEPTIDE ISOMER-A [synthetic construct]
ACDCRGDCFCG